MNNNLFNEMISHGGSNRVARGRDPRPYPLLSARLFPSPRRSASRDSCIGGMNEPQPALRPKAARKRPSTFSTRSRIDSMVHRWRLLPLMRGMAFVVRA
jgi:hypothetical protein